MAPHPLVRWRASCRSCLAIACIVKYEGFASRAAAGITVGSFANPHTAVKSATCGFAIHVPSLLTYVCKRVRIYVDIGTQEQEIATQMRRDRQSRLSVGAPGGLSRRPIRRCRRAALGPRRRQDRDHPINFRHDGHSRRSNHAKAVPRSHEYASPPMHKSGHETGFLRTCA